MNRLRLFNLLAAYFAALPEPGSAKDQQARSSITLEMHFAYRDTREALMECARGSAVDGYFADRWNKNPTFDELMQRLEFLRSIEGCWARGVDGPTLLECVKRFSA